MNREQKRAFEKSMSSKGKTKDEIKRFIDMKERMNKKGSLEEGQPVRLNLSKIKSHPDYTKMRDEYKKFVEDNAETDFTVEYEPKYPNHSIVMLKEDTTVPKWLWWEDDLEKI